VPPGRGPRLFEGARRGGSRDATGAGAYRASVSPSHAASAAISPSTPFVIAREADVLVDGVHAQDPGLAVRRRVELPDQPVVVQDRQREVAPAPLRRGLVHLEDVLEAEEVGRPGPVVDQAVERGQQRRAARERAVERRGVHPPGPGDALDDGGLARIADVDRLHRHRGALRTGDPERAQAALVADGESLLARDDRRAGRVHALGEVPQPLAALAPGDRDLAAHREELEHLGHVAVVRPPGRRPGLDVRVRDVARHERAAGAEEVEHVAPEAVVAFDPPVSPGAARRRHVGEVEAQVARGPHHRVVLEQRAIALERGAKLLGVVRRAQPRPRDEVGARGDRGGRVELQEREALDEREQARRALRVEHLRADRDPPRLLEGEAVRLLGVRRGGGHRCRIFPGCARAIHGERRGAFPEGRVRFRPPDT
jgi:hypothetical protein